MQPGWMIPAENFIAREIFFACQRLLSRAREPGTECAAFFEDNVILPRKIKRNQKSLSAGLSSDTLGNPCCGPTRGWKSTSLEAIWQKQVLRTPLRLP
jgi:hypothetical protein